MDAEPQSVPEAQGTSEEHSDLGRLRGIKFVQRAVIAPPAVVWRVVAEPRIAEFIPA